MRGEQRKQIRVGSIFKTAEDYLWQKTEGKGKEEEGRVHY